MTGPNRFLEDVVLGVVHMHILRGVKNEIVDMITDKFKEEEIQEARDMLTEQVQVEKMGGHKTTDNRSAAKVYAQELVELVSQLDKEGKMPKIVVSSDQLPGYRLGRAAWLLGMWSHLVQEWWIWRILLPS